MQQARVYQHKFLTNLSRAKRDFLSAQDFEEIPYDQSLELLLNRIGNLEGDPGLKRNSSGKYSVWRLCFASLASSRVLISQSLSWCFLFASCALISTISNRSFIDSLGSFSQALCFGLLFLFGEIAGRYARYREANRRVQVGLASQFYLLSLINAKLADLDPESRSRFSSGNLKTLVGSDINNIGEFIWATLWGLVPCVMLTIVLTPTLYFMLGDLGLIAVALTFVQVPLALGFTFLLEKFVTRVQESRDHLTTRVGEWLRSMRLVRSLGWQKAISRDIADTVHEYSLRDVPRYLTESITYSVSTGWWMVPVLGLLVFSKLLDIPLSVGSFFGALWALGYLSTYVQWLPYPISRYAAAASSMKRIAELLDAPSLSRALQKEPEKPLVPQEARFLILTEIRAGYQERDLLHIDYLRLDLKELCAVVGKVGSGKSTLIKLLAGELIPRAGRIQWEDASGALFDLWQKPYYEAWRDQIAIVQQEPFLSNASLERNVSLEDPSDASRLQAAAEAAELLEDVAQFPDGFQQEVGETGINLSGGQKSRVSFARAYYSGRHIVFLDDPLSAVDERTESRLMSRLFKEEKGGIIVSHRFRELDRCRRVLVLDDGRIIEDGNPLQLAKSPGSAFSALREYSEEQEHEEEESL